jgi:hypothetical protein
MGGRSGYVNAKRSHTGGIHALHGVANPENLRRLSR